MTINSNYIHHKVLKSKKLISTALDLILSPFIIIDEKVLIDCSSNNEGKIFGEVNNFNLQITDIQDKSSKITDYIEKLNNKYDKQLTDLDIRFADKKNFKNEDDYNNYAFNILRFCLESNFFETEGKFNKLNKMIERFSQKNGFEFRENSILLPEQKKLEGFYIDSSKIFIPYTIRFLELETLFQALTK